MGRHIHLQPHLSVEELERRYRAATQPHERIWWQILWLLAQGRTATELASVTGYSAYWIGQIAKRYNEAAPAGMHNRQHTIARRAEPRLSPALQEALADLAPDDDRWSGRTVAERMTARLGRPSRASAAGATCSGSSPRPATAYPVRGMRWPTHKSKRPAKRVRPLVRAVATAVPRATVKLWATDEHPIGPGAVARAGTGRRPGHGPTPSCSTASPGAIW
jgi:hypothetical protein